MMAPGREPMALPPAGLRERVLEASRQARAAGRATPEGAEISAAEAFSRAADAFHGLLCALGDEDWRRPAVPPKCWPQWPRSRSTKRLRPGDPALSPATYPCRKPRAIRHAELTEGVQLAMSILVIGKFQGDTATFRQALTDRAGEFAKIADEARAAGAIHHRFGVGDGFVVIVDEWETAGQFQQFFSNPDLQAFIGSVGAAPGPPEITIAEAVASADQF